VKKTLLFALIAVIFFNACTKISTTELGTGLIPAVDGVNTFEEILDVTADNILDDSMRISKYNEQALGYISDPIFGSTLAIMNLELKPVYYPQGFEVRQDSLTLDSAVLVLKYIDVWGDSTLPISFDVYELADKLNWDSAYPNYYKFPHNTNTFPTTTKLSVDKTFDIRKFNDVDTSRLGSFIEASTNQIRIPLNAAFGNKLLHVFDTTLQNPTPNNAYASDSIFSERFHGFSIVPKTSANALLRVALQDTNTKLVLYYKYKQRTAGSNDTTSIRYFRPGLTAASANNIIRVRNGESSTTSALNSTPKDSLLYLQSNPGHHISIKIPGLENQSLSNRVVHRAELYMEQAPDINTGSSIDYFTPPNLFLTAWSKDSARRFHIPNDIAYSTSDGTVSNISSFGGYITYKNDNVSGKRIATYAFNISRYVQGIVTRKETAYDLNLFAPGYDYVYTAEKSSVFYPIYGEQLNPPGIGRVRLFGGSINHPNKMKLRIIYSKL